MTEDTDKNEINKTYDDLKQVIDNASRIKTDINSNCKESLKSMKQDFANFMLDNVAEDFKGVAERLGLFNAFAEIDDKSKREKKIDAALRSFFGKMFNKTKDFEFLKKGGKPKESTPPKCDTYVADMIASLYASRLIPEVTRALDNAGIEIRFTKPITKLDLVNNEDDKKTVIDYFTRGANVQNEIFEKNAEIDDVVYETIPDDMKYDKDSNPKGIKKAQFQALAELQSKTDDMSMNGDADKATDIVEKQSDKHFDNAKNQEMLAIVTELIIAKNDAPTKPASYDESVQPVSDSNEGSVSSNDNGFDSYDENLSSQVPSDMD